MMRPGVDGDDLPPHLEGRLQKRHLVLDARVVHHDVEPAELFHGPLYQRLDGFGFRDVGPDGDGPASASLA
jgi:hypothetical protein